MLKNKAKYLIHIVFPLLIFIFTSKLFAYVISFRETFIDMEAIQMHILVTTLFLVILSIVYGYLICSSRSKQIQFASPVDRKE